MPVSRQVHDREDDLPHAGLDLRAQCCDLRHHFGRNSGNGALPTTSFCPERGLIAVRPLCDHRGGLACLNAALIRTGAISPRLHSISNRARSLSVSRHAHPL